MGLPASIDPPNAMDDLDLDAFAATPRVRDPFDYLVVPAFLKPAAQAAIRAVFPVSAHGGVEPAAARDPHDALGRMLAAFHDPLITRMFADKFDVDLDPAALMITLRSRCRPADGKIHTDSTAKRVTALIYLEPEWTASGGRLRFLKGPDNLNDMLAEVPPVNGTLLAFRRSDNSWHGHAPFDGVRRIIMLNWMTSPAAARRELGRHAVSAGIKRLLSV
jgi:SM-20-related protein